MAAPPDRDASLMVALDATVVATALTRIRLDSTGGDLDPYKAEIVQPAQISVPETSDSRTVRILKGAPGQGVPKPGPEMPLAR